MGIVYLIQPAEVVGTDRANVGCSEKSDLTRVLQYKKGTKLLSIFYTEHPFTLDKAIINIFKSHFTKIAGNEYFMGNIDEMRKIFVKQIYSSFIPNRVQLNDETNHDNDEQNYESDEDYIATYEGFLKEVQNNKITEIVITKKQTEEGFVRFKYGDIDCVKIS